MFDHGYQDAKVYHKNSGSVPLELTWHRGISSDIKDYMRGWNEYVKNALSDDVVLKALSAGYMVSFEI